VQADPSGFGYDAEMLSAAPFGYAVSVFTRRASLSCKRVTTYLMPFMLVVMFSWSKCWLRDVHLLLR
jgi:hypothetical protein